VPGVGDCARTPPGLISPVYFSRRIRAQVPGVGDCARTPPGLIDNVYVQGDCCEGGDMAFKLGFSEKRREDVAAVMLRFRADRQRVCTGRLL
jgi:hypothetical protein